jgi:hypothetical protein
MGSILHIDQGAIHDTDVAWTRLQTCATEEASFPTSEPAVQNNTNKTDSHEDDDNDGDRGGAGNENNDYVTLPGHGLLHNAVQSPCPLIEEIRKATDPENRADVIDAYSSIGQVHHFVFRKDVQVRGHTNKDCGTLPQCFNPPLDFPFRDVESKQRVWCIYEQLCLRMRLGAATSGVTRDYKQTLLDRLVSSANEGDVGTTQSIDSTVALMLAESAPETNGITYVIEGKLLFLAMHGRGFELYATLPASIPINDATASAAMLARTLVVESDQLFLVEPLTWK